jgi:UDP-glucose 4-epimerase
MKVLVTGGAGFIGSHVADAALAAGHEVAVIDDLSTGRRDNVPANAHFIEADIRDADAVEKAFASFRPQMISHQAAQTSVSVSTREPVRDADINVLGGLRVLDACVKHEVERVVFASTGGAIYGEVPEARAGIETPPRPLSPYACSKFAFEAYLGAYAHEHGLKSSVLRYANVYGPRQDPHGEAGVVAIFCERLLRREPIRINARKTVGDDGCVRDYVYVGDVVRANMCAIDKALPSAVLNVCTGEATTTLALALQLDSLLGGGATIEHAPRRAGDVERSVLEPGALDALGPRTSLADGLAATLDWFRER